ncbi:MAG: universal stress protein [Propionibacteriales bacterium]|nr:universal stress protein [Propionibacteriales bacterium]
MDTTSLPHPGTVVVGYDGSDHAELALRWAADEADLDGRALTIVTVVNTMTSYELSALGAGWTTPVEIRDSMRKHALDALERAKAALHGSLPELEVETVLREGDARQVLLELSGSAASLFVGSRGRGPIASLVLGSVSVAVSRAAACPVFVVRPPRPEVERHGVLVGTDATEQTRPTLEFAYRQAALRDLPLTVLHCFDSVETVYGTGMILDDDLAGYDDERRELAEAVAGLGEKFPEVDVRLRLGRGLPDVCLIQESAGHDLLVVGHHQGRNLGDMIHLGSFVAPVVENAKCPVAVVVDRSAKR